MRRDWDSFWTTCWEHYRRQMSEGAAVALACAAVLAALVLLGVLPREALWFSPLALYGVGMTVLAPFLYHYIIRASISEAREQRGQGRATARTPRHWRP